VRSPLTVILLLFLIAGSATPQDAGGSRTLQVTGDSIGNRNTASFFFDKTINTYHWNGLARYRNSFDAFLVDLDARFLSTIIRANRPIVRDDEALRFSVRRRLTDRFTGLLSTTSFGISDDQNIGIGSASSHTFHAGVEYSPLPAIRIEPRLGMRFDNQIDQHDQGLSAFLGASVEDFDIGGYLTDLHGSHQIDMLSPRRIETHGDSLIIRKRFPGGTRNLLSGTYNRSRREFYFAADSVIQATYGESANIETRTDNVMTISDALDYRAGDRTTISLQGNILNRSVTRSSRYRNILDTRRTPLNSAIDEFRIDGGVQVRYDAGDYEGVARFFYQERDEQHRTDDDADIPDSVLLPFQTIQERKNNHSRRTALALDVRIYPGDSDTLQFSGSTGLLRYDTQALLNDDDRDELSYFFTLTAMHRFSDHLNLRVMAEAHLAHLVYIKGTRSSDNTWNRVIRLAPELDFRPYASLFSRNRFEVLANYTVYDFEYLASTIRSYVFRQFSFIDSTSVELTPRIGLDWYSNLRFYDRGELRWAEFSERPLQYFEDRTFIGTLRYRPGPHLLFSAGLRYFSQSRFLYSGSDRSLESFLRSAGPITAIEWKPSGRYQLQFSGWYESQTLTGQPARNFANLAMSLLIQI
jgi:hypothetical protein